MRRSLYLIGIGFIVAGAGCPASVPALCDNGACEPGDGGSDVDGGGADVVAPLGCDLTKPPKDSPACIDDAEGVFVAPSGDDGATGKKSSPVKTIAKGLELAASKGVPRVYVSEGTYEAAAEIKAPVSVYGGLSSAWAYTGAKPKLAPAKGVALRVTKVTGAVIVEDLEVVGSADASKSGDSAIAAFVSESTNVTFRNLTLSAGPGTDGAKGVGASNYSAAAKQGIDSVNGGTAVTCACLDGTTSSVGGKGGAIGADGDAGSATPTVGTANGGLGGGVCNPGTIGTNGQAGASGTGATRPGSVTNQGWLAADDVTTTSNGNPGQGGGGGGGRVGLAGGGGGGCGGCGGAGGKAGGAGGSSFALLSFQSAVVVDGGTLKTSTGGTGGTGGTGQDGQAGGTPGTGACNGGPGGNGAGGSGGGGGAGGHSVPIAFVGAEPQATGAAVTPGTKGGLGAGGQPGAGPGTIGTAGTSGPDGKAQNTLAL
jgi:hypothetical protein